MANGMQMTLDEWVPEAFLTPIAGVSDLRAKTSQSAEIGKDLTATRADSFWKSSDSSKKPPKKIDPNGCSLKMLGGFLVATGEQTSLKSSIGWTTLGTMRNGSLSTANILAYLRTENECTLSDILEDTVSEKYFLSANVVKRFLSYRDTKIWLLER